MKSKDKDEIMKASKDLMLSFGGFTIMLVLLIISILTGTFNIIFCLEILLFICDVALIYLTHRRLKFILNTVE